MNEARLEYYDPLFETITFQKGLPSKLAFLFTDASVDPRRIIRTAEFARLAFLRQAGLAWLVLPSAAHTRFAYSIGCWGLARLAESLIRVAPSSQQTCSLSLWLKSVDLREEFYLGLLCHGIGHGPLSNILERNQEFIAGLSVGSNVTLNYKRRGAALLEGQGELAKTWEQIAHSRYGTEVTTFRDINKRTGSSDYNVCVPAICYLITSDTQYLEKCAHPHKEHLGLVKDLVNGLLALRQLDHFAQDSYFSGLRQFSVNLRGFLSNLSIFPLPGEAATTRFSVAESGVPYAAKLLSSKRQSLLSTPRNPQILALHSMVEWALNIYLKSLVDISLRTRACTRIAFMEDEQFVETITGIEHLGCRYIGQRIRAVRPYAYVGRWPILQVQPVLGKFMEAFRVSEKFGDDTSPAHLSYLENGFSAPVKEAHDCFTSNGIFIGNTDIPLSQHPDYKNNFQHLEKSSECKYLYLFTRDDQRIEEIKSKANLICRR